MLSLLPAPQCEASDPPAPVTIDKAMLLSVADPWHRSQLANAQVRYLEAQLNAVLGIRRDAIGELVNKRRTPLAAVASYLGLTKARIGQLAKAALRALDGGDRANAAGGDQAIELGRDAPLITVTDERPKLRLHDGGALAGVTA